MSIVSDIVPEPADFWDICDECDGEGMGQDGPLVCPVCQGIGEVQS